MKNKLSLSIIPQIAYFLKFPSKLWRGCVVCKHHHKPARAAEQQRPWSANQCHRMAESKIHKGAQNSFEGFLSRELAANIGRVFSVSSLWQGQAMLFLQPHQLPPQLKGTTLPHPHLLVATQLLQVTFFNFPSLYGIPLFSFLICDNTRNEEQVFQLHPLLPFHCLTPWTSPWLPSTNFSLTPTSKAHLPRQKNKFTSKTLYKYLK